MGNIEKNFSLDKWENKAEQQYSLVRQLFLDLYNRVEKDTIISVYERLYHYIAEDTSYSRYGAYLATIYKILFDINKTTKISSDYFFVFAQYKWETYLTEFALNFKEEIEPIIKQVVDEDYELNNINFLFRLYTFKDGSIYYPGEVYTNEYLDSFWSNQKELTNRQVLNGTPFIDDVLVPDDDKNKAITYISLVVREAENRYRQKKGVPRVGEGWISESQLFRRLEAAFPNETVLQHAHPTFLGQQHYDVYFPERKIAIEYQGEQHYRPIEHFGGEKAFKKCLELDKRKREISKQNQVELIEVSSDYNMEVLLKKIVISLSEQNNAYVNINKSISDALIKAYSSDIEKHIFIKSDINKDLAALIKETSENDRCNSKLDEEILFLINKRIPSEKTRKFKDVHGDEFDKAISQYENIEKIKKANPSEAYSQGMYLINEGIYAAPAIYGCMAQILRAQKKFKEEFELLLQMKRDFDYTNYDDRIRNLYKRIKLL